VALASPGDTVWDSLPLPSPQDEARAEVKAIAKAATAAALREVRRKVVVDEAGISLR